MRKLLFLFLAFPLLGISSPNKMITPLFGDTYRFGQVNIFKVSPSFYRNIMVRGGVLSYETGAGIPDWTFNFSVKYFSKTDSSEFVRGIREHLRFEVQSRFWIVDYINGLYFSPLVNVYSTGDIGGGAVFGFQLFLTKFLVVDGFSGVQTITPVENAPGQLFLRYGLNIGVAFY